MKRGAEMGWPVPHFSALTKAQGLGSTWGQHFCYAVGARLRNCGFQPSLCQTWLLLKPSDSHVTTSEAKIIPFAPALELIRNVL